MSLSVVRQLPCNENQIQKADESFRPPLLIRTKAFATRAALGSGLHLAERRKIELQKRNASFQNFPKIFERTAPALASCR
jgi:hypothetical protein